MIFLPFSLCMFQSPSLSLDGKTRTCLVMSPYLIKAMRKILCYQQYHLSEIWTNTKLNLLIFFVTNFKFFLCGSNWWRITWRYGKQNFGLLQLIIPEIMRILLSFFIFSYLQWTMITTKPTSTLYCYLLCPLGRCPYMSYSILQSLLHLNTLDTFFTIEMKVC